MTFFNLLLLKLRKLKTAAFSFLARSSHIIAGECGINMGLQNSNLPGCTSESLNTSLETVGDKMRAEGFKTHLIGESA